MTNDDESEYQRAAPAVQWPLVMRHVAGKLRLIFVFIHRGISLPRCPETMRCLVEDEPTVAAASTTKRRTVTELCGHYLAAVAAPQRVKHAVLVDATVGVRSEEVALPLHEGGGKPLRA